MKIQSLRYEGSVHLQQEVLGALAAACAPFGSLCGPDLPREEIPRLMLAALEARGDVVAHALGGLAQALRKTDADQLAELRVSGPSIAVVTPTSATEIGLGASGDHLVVSVNFGASGSTQRAAEILSAAMTSGLTFAAQSDEGRLTHQQVRALLLERARNYLTWLEGLPVEYYPEDYRTRATASARARVAELSEAN